MEKVEFFLSNMLQLQRLGGRVKRPNDHTLVLMDVSVWGHLQAAQLKEHFPCCEVRCEANPTSLSGFMVIVERKWQDLTTFWFTIYWTVLLCLGAALRYLTVTVVHVSV